MSIRGYKFTNEQLALLLDDGLFRGVPAWGRTYDYILSKNAPIVLDESVKVHKSVVDFLSGGEVQIKDETASEDRDVIWTFNLVSLKRGLELYHDKYTRSFQVLVEIFKASLDKATDLTEYGNAVIQLGLFGEIKY